MDLGDFLISPRDSTRRPGPNDKIVISSRIRLARNLQGIPFPGWGKKPAAWALPIAVACGVALMVLRALEHRQIMPFAVYNLKWPVVALGVGAGLLFVLTNPPRFLEWRPLAWIGKVSYGVYVINAAFGGWLHDHFSLEQAPLIFVIQLALTLPLAALSYYLFEAPILSLKSRWPMPARAATPHPVAAPSHVGAGVLAHDASHPLDPRS